MEPNPFCTNRSPAGDACGECEGCVQELKRIRQVNCPHTVSTLVRTESHLCRLRITVDPYGGADAWVHLSDQANRDHSADP